MDNLGDWLYIVLIVIAGISSLLSSIKKKKQPEEILRQPDPGEYQDYWDWETAPQPQPAEAKKKEEAPGKPAYIPLFKEGERSMTLVADAFDQAEEPSQENAFCLSGESFQDIDEWKKAVIYSEILNRKY
ncbi:MAG: hypothetical protein LBS88_11135 [Tannerellaceae bacterium]|jgi:hypothetical protein|nr:hypothetical protein [Tannerellaceae bacterium]